MTTILNMLDGKKTYIVAFIGASLGLYMAFDPSFVPPAWVDFILVSLGGAALRAAK